MIRESAGPGLALLLRQGRAGREAHWTLNVVQPAMSERDAIGALVVGDFVADPFTDGLAMEIERHVGVDEVEASLGAVGDGLV